MSQAVNVETSSAKPKRQYRKGNPLSDADKQRAAVAKKRATHKEVKVFLAPESKQYLMSMCEADGLTQAEVLTVLIEKEARRRDII
ncbi:replication regulatory protein RepA [Lelliottia nimipressuralis]|uniref:replication regulatory protein RepA n=1 Tax=Lelliottia nimipressuralis TaxID=69220 RepID=UPI0028A0EB17|nr:replication regulatory protein RepA [Lelliottia nimipressuralis]